MAVPDQQFQDIIEQIEKTVQETIQAELKTIQTTKPPPFLDLDEFREQLLEAVRDELRVFKEELLTELQNTPAPPTSVVSQQQKSTFWQEFWRELLFLDKFAKK